MRIVSFFGIYRICKKLLIMKYIKLFEEFRGTKDNSHDLIEALGRYQQLIEDGMGYGDSRKYFDILSRISEHMVQYREIFEYVLRTRFDRDSDRLYTNPSNKEALTISFQFLKGIIKRGWNQFFFQEQWQLVLMDSKSNWNQLAF